MEHVLTKEVQVKRAKAIVLVILLVWAAGDSLLYTQSQDQSFAFPDSSPRKRARELGITIGHMTPGKWNAITDVPGVRVGHSTVVFGSGPLVVGKGPARTGVTAVIPHEGLIWRENVPAAAWVLNGNGDMTGTKWLNEKGALETPILLTNSWSVGAVFDHFLSWAYHVDKDFYFDGCDPVVAETWDGFLNDIRGRHVHKEHVFAALNGAKSGPVEEGAVGGGTGMSAFDFKAGIGTASRLVETAGRSYTVGVLVQANFGSRHLLRIDGVPVGREITDLMPVENEPDGSFLAVLATDAPLDHRQLRRLTKRIAMGLARTGSIAHNGSGDLMIAFSTGYRITEELELETRPALKPGHMNPLFEATVEATDEAIVNSLCMAKTTVGRDGNTIYAIPLDRLQAIMKKYGRLDTGS
jgi:D-aminopeptidase